MRTKEEDTIELAMRLVVAIRTQSMLHSNGMTTWLAGSYDNENTRDLDRKLARDLTAMARNFVEEMHQGAGNPTPAPDALIQQQKAPAEGFISEPLDWQTEMDATIRDRESARKPNIEAP